MLATQIPDLQPSELQSGLRDAANSPRRRHPKILHQVGDEFNRVFNFMKEDTYMQPHLHPGKEKIEKMYLVKGSFSVLFFDNEGSVEKVVDLKKGARESIEIPAFAWHTYVMRCENVVVYETMMGKYEPETWKTLADWAPSEDNSESNSYLASLKQHKSL